MIRSRLSQPRGGGAVQGVHQPLVVVPFELGLDAFAEVLGDRIGRGAAGAVVDREVVHDVARAHHHDALLAQGRQLAADLVVEGGRLGPVEAELDHRHIGLGIEVHQHGPCAVVQAPALALLHRRRRQQLSGAGRQLRRPGRRIAEVVKRLGKPIEVVHGRRLGHGGDGHAASHPMTRDHQNRPGSGQTPPKIAPGLDIIVLLESRERAAVAHEEGGRAIGCGGHAASYSPCAARGRPRSATS